MYKVIIREGINKEERTYNCLRDANNYVIEKASEMGIHYGWDADGIAYAHDEWDGPSSTRIEIEEL